jgi:hypothetical protein
MGTLVSPTTAPAVAAASPVVKVDPNDKSLWEYVEIPETDLFDQPFGTIQINFIDYAPGKHFVNAELAGEIRRLLKQRQVGDLRVLRPTQDKKMQEIMARSGKAVPRYNPDMSAVNR